MLWVLGSEYKDEENNEPILIQLIDKHPGYLLCQAIGSLLGVLQ